MGLEVRTPELTVSDSPLEITANTQDVLIGEGTKELEVTVNRREYSIVGDELYIPKRYEEAPQWLRDIIDTVTSATLSGALSDVSTLGDMLDRLIAELNVAKNTYTMSIISDNDINERINTAIETLNSSLAESDSTILNIATTRVTPEEAQAIVIGILSASISGGDIAAAVQNLQSAIASVDSARALDYTRLTAQIGDGLDEEVTARAEAVQYLNTYVGIDADGGLVGTGLLADVSILQKQNDGVIETTTGTYDVMSGIENPNTNIDNDQLLTGVEPYASWTPMSGAGIPTYNGELVNRVYKDTTNTKYYIVGSSAWVETTEANYKLYSTWLRSAHVGDVFIKYTSSTEGYKTYDKAYKFIKTIVDGTSPYSTDTEGYTWALIVDTDAQNAYVAALNAYDLADDKRRTFVDTPVAPYDEGDIWIDSSGIYSIVKVYNGVDWVTADEQITKFADTIYTPGISGLQNQVDGKIEYYFQNYTDNTPYNMTGFPTGSFAVADRASRNGDVIHFTNTTGIGANKSYYYSSSTNSWNTIEDATALLAIEKAAEAKGAADGVVVSYYATYSDTAPVTSKLWLNKTGTKVLKEYNGSTWVAVAVKEGDTLTAVSTGDTFIFLYYNGSWITETENGVVAGSESVTNLNIGLTALGTTVNGHTILLNTVDARINSEGARVESKFSYNSVLALGGVNYTSGFGLATSLTSGSGLTGADSEFWIKSDKFKLMSADGGTKSAYSPFSVDATTGVINFNGKVTFSSISDSAAYIPTISSVTTAQAIANNAVTNAATANTLLADIASDNKLTPDEKQSTKKEWDIIASEYSKNITQASLYNVSNSTYTTAYNALNTYLSSLLSNLTTTSDISGTTFRDNFKSYYDARTDLLNAFTKATSNIRPNILPNGGFEQGFTWNKSGLNWFHDDGVWGSIAAAWPTTSGIYAIWSDEFVVQPGENYVITGDSILIAESGLCYFDIQFLDANGNTVLDGAQNPVVGAHDFSIETKRDAHATQCVSPANARKAVARFVCDVTNPTVIGCRLIKVERGALPYTAYSNEATLSTLTKVEDISWQSEVQAAINNNATTIDGGKIVTNTLYGDRLIGNTVSADKLTSSTGTSTTWSGGGLVSQNFNGNVYGNIGSPTSGFRLSSNAAGVASDPNIYGAYIKGSTIAASVLSVDSLKIETASGRLAALSFTSNNSIQNIFVSNYELHLDTIWSPEYSSGYYNKRVSSYSTPINLSMNCFIDINDITCFLEVSYNGGGWGTIESRSQNGNGNTGFTWTTTFVPSSSGWSYLTLRYRFSGAYLRSASANYLVINGT